MSLTAANEARLENILNKWRRDAATGAIYTIRQRVDNGQIHSIVSEIEDGKVTGYGFILTRDADDLNYMTDVFNMPKIAYDALLSEGVNSVTLNHDTLTLA